jgi:hypothetical protein
MKWKIAVVVFASMIFFSIARNVLACKGSAVLFEDNFATLDPAWGQQSDRQSVKDGKLIIQPEVNAGWTAINQGNIFEDMDACVKVTITKAEDPNWGGGFVFWAKDYNDYYYLLISGDGQLAVKRWTNNRTLSPVDWRETTAIKKGVGQTNELRVVAKGNQATVYVNDTEVVTFKGQPPQGGGFIGVRGSSAEKSPITWEFSDLKITKP